MAIFGSEDESIFDNMLLYLYQTIVLVSLAAAGFIFYLFRTRAPLKAESESESRHESRYKNGQVSAGNFDSPISDDDLLRAALLPDRSRQDSSKADFALPDNPYPFLQPSPVQASHSPKPRPKPKPSANSEEEEEEEEEEGPVRSKQPILQMVTTRQGVKEETVNYPHSFQDPNKGYTRVHTIEAIVNRSGGFSPIAPPQPMHRSGGFDNALKVEAKKRIGNAIQKKQVQEWVGGGEFDEAITNIRAASQRLQNSGF